MPILKQVAVGVVLALIFSIVLLGAQITTSVEARLGTPYPALLRASTLASCPTARGWIAYHSQINDTLASIARSVDISVDELMRANCLTEELLPGETVYLPSSLHQPVDTPCGPPAGWEFYIIEVDDRLEDLAANNQVSMNELRNANCLGDQTSVRVRERLYLPPHSDTSVTQTVLAERTPTFETGPTEEVTPEPTKVP